MIENVIAIDGPSGSGKSTMAKKLASALDVLYVDTGAMFRALGLYAFQKNISFEEGAAIQQMLKEIDFKYGIDDECLIEINSENLTQKIREHEVSFYASQVSQIPSVRSFLLGFQRSLPQSQICVMEGRDIATVVFPHSFCKMFVTASIEVRAMRRLKQLSENNEKDKNVNLKQVMEDVRQRDQRDSSRDMAPLKQASDAILFDTSNMTESEVLEKMISTVQQKAKKVGLVVKR